MWLNDFEFDVIWAAFQLLLKLHFLILVLWPFCRISLIFKFSLLGIGLKMKTQKWRNIFIFGFITLRYMRICFFDHYFHYLNVKSDINKNWLNVIYPKGSKAFKTTSICYMIRNMGESFWIWCRLNSISTVLKATCSSCFSL